MPPDEDGCVLGAENKTNLENLKNSLDEFKIEVRASIAHIDKVLTELELRWSSRLPLWSTFLISSLFTAIGILVTLALRK